MSDLEIRTFVAPAFGQNAYLVWKRGDSWAIAIDPGGVADAMATFLAREGLWLEAILLTHAHIDHIEGVGTLEGRTGAAIHLHPADRPLYDRVADQGGMFGMRVEAQPPIDHDLHLLSDSNLDWGQDLKGLAEWREQNRGKPLYISYFGTADPRYYIPDAIILPGGLVGDATKPPEGIRSDSFLAVSASCLQGTYTQGGFLDSLKRVCLPGREVALIGGSIYVFLMPAQPPDRTR
jgi:hypothetical protein